MNRIKDIIKKIDQISGRYSPYEVFTDWIRCGAIAISNTCSIFQGETWKEREQLYLDTMKKYSKNEQDAFIQMLGLLTETLETNIMDALGAIYMESGMGSKTTGQFFTPYHLSEAIAELTILDPDENGKIVINEPSCGGGGMIIAAASNLKRKGINYQRVMEVVAQDLDWKSVYMCYLQLSLLGISAICVQGDTLSEPYIPGKTEKSRILITPMKAGALI